ncbi:MAG: TIR domain-containing protein [Desulfuromonadales bacterium]|nr:TIR domain-containing protein [Desulfuromonadales bacterium]
MGAIFQPPLAVHFVWHPSDQGSVDPILEIISTHLARNVDRPFSRALNFPLFLYSSNSPTLAPENFPQELASRNVVFVLTSVNTRGHDKWNEYIRDMSNADSMRVVPVALDHDGLGHSGEGSLKGRNFIRAYDWPKKSAPQHAILAMTHEIFRYGFAEIDSVKKGNSSSIKLFLSHSKSGDTGKLHAESLKHFIENTNMSHFFDETEISPGFKFNDEIINHIKGSTVIAISSDAYSSRYWCQREILCAKEHFRPMIAVDCLEEYEDRIFPAGSNVPCVHVSPEPPLSEEDILRILVTAILETVRHRYAVKLLEYYRERGWISADCALLPRPPEVRQLLSLKADGKINKICYPEPPIYSEEADWHRQLGIETFTPLWRRDESNSLHELRIGISISNIANNGYGANHLPASQTTRLAQDLARHLLARSATLIYGGDLREDGFTEFILNEAVALKSRLNSDGIYVENHLAWPLHVADPKLTAWRAKYRDVMDTVNHNIPDDIAGEIDKDHSLPPSSPENKYYLSRCLTEMRQKSIASTNARVCVGGKLSGYSGKMPGVLEEILIAINNGQPIYLLGAFGGVVGEVCKLLRDKSYPKTLTEAWQATHNAGYVDLQEIATKHGMQADYGNVKSVLERVDISDIVINAGLDKETYLRLMESPFVDECIHIVLQGLKKVAAQDMEHAK